MKRLTMVKVWACAPVTQNWDGEIHTANRNPQAFYANIQSDRNAVDAAAYGETLDQIIKLRTDTLPPVEVSHAIYLTKPEPIGTAELDGVSYDDYGPGEYLVQSVSPAVIGVSAVRNPTVITARIVTQ